MTPPGPEQTTPPVAPPATTNLTALLLDRHVAEGRGERTAIIDADGGHSYAAVSERVDRAAGALAALGVEPEQRVALVMLDTVDFVAAFLGAIKLGAVPVPLNTLLTADDYRYLLRDSRARALIVSDALVGKLAPAIADAPLLRAVAVATSPLGGDPGPHPAWTALLDGASPRRLAADTSADEVAFWLYSSGSTGRPKGARVHTGARELIG